jgi:PAS domain S-box-containing protein
MPRNFVDLIDVQTMQGLLDAFCEAVGISSAIIDLEGTVLISSNWQRICTDFHRVNPETCAKCIESDTCLANRLNEGRTYAVYPCQNGLTDSAAPILIEREHVANLFIGQVLLREPDETLFHERARRYGFDEKEYLEALSLVPIIPEEKLIPILEYLSQLARTLGMIGLKEIRRQEAEAALRESEQRFRSLIQTAPTVILCLSPDCRIIEFNPEAERLFGRRRGEVLGEAYLESFVPEKHREAIAEDIRKVLRGDPTRGFENPVRVKGGEERVLLWNVDALFNDEGQPSGVVCVAQDITERKRAEEALRASERNYREIFDASNDAIFVHDGETGAILDVNQRVSEMVGYTREELLRSTVGDLSMGVHPYTMEGAQQWIGKAVQEGPQTFEWMTKRKNGEVFWAEINLKQATIGGQRRVLAVTRDISERKRVEEEMRQLRNLLANIVDSMPSVLVGVDAEGRVTQWNREAERSTGVSALDARGCFLADVFPNLAGQMENVRRAIRDRKPLKAAKVLTRIEGESRFEDITVYPLVSNGVDGAVVRVDDVTDRVRIEEIMIQSEKMRSVGELAAGMAHEINNPLAGILQNVQVVRDRITTATEKNRQTAAECGTTIEAIEAYLERRGIGPMIQAVMDSGRRAARIVDNMLSFSRRSDSEFAMHDLANLLDRTVDLVRNDYDLKKKFDFRQIEILREYDSDLSRVPCDAGKIQQVFLNLLKNGAQAMSEIADRESRKPRFILRTLRDGEMARVEIEDNGPGIGEEERKRVFEPFFTTKDVGVGTGLGLSVSYFIVTENHRGTLNVESIPGERTRFILRIPLEKPTA